jgi:hypothetical protein
MLRGLSLYIQGLNLTNEPFVTNPRARTCRSSITRGTDALDARGHVQVRRGSAGSTTTAASAASAASGDADLPGRVSGRGDGNLPGASASAAAGTGARARKLI